MSTREQERDLCALCGETTATSPWIVLNRWVIGTGRGRAMVEATRDGEYAWLMEPYGSADDEEASGHVLHWPGCATAWIDAKMIETDFDLGIVK